MSPARQKNKNGEWKETCIGMWSRNVISGNRETSPPVCMGVLLVRLKNKELDSVQPTNTLGLQVIVQDTEVNEDEAKTPQNGKIIWQQEASSPVEMLANFKDKSQRLTNTLKDFATSPDRKDFFNKTIHESYKQIREWSDKFWK